jgi:hypothetical protein
MANNPKRQVSVFINDAAVEGSIKNIQGAFKKASNELAKMVVGSDEYIAKLEEVKKLKQPLDQHNAQLRNIGKGVEQASGFLEEFAGIAAGAFAVDQVIAMGRQVFDLGIRMDQLDKKAQIVFGETLPFVTKQAEANAQAMGLTNAQYIAAAANIQDLLVPMGFQREEAAAISTELVNLSGALSEWSTTGITAIEVNEILSDALLGERDSLKQLGISISQADVDAALLTKGLDKLTGASRQQAEAAVTLELITQKSADAQAAYATNTESAARQQAVATAKFQEIAEKVATTLLPVFTKLLSIVNAVGSAFLYIVNAGQQAEKTNSSLADSVRKLQSEFNTEIEVLKTGNFTQDERKQIITEINSKYGEYLPNLLTEKSSIEQIGIAQAAANKVFAQKIIYLSLQDEITEATKRGAQAAKAAFAVEKERAELAAKSNFEDNSQYEEYIKGQVEVLGGLRKVSLETVQNVPEEINKIRDTYGKLAGELGTTLSALEQKFAAARGVGGGGTGTSTGQKEVEQEINWQKVWNDTYSQRVTAVQGVNRLIEQEQAKSATVRGEISLAELNTSLLQFEEHQRAKKLVMLNYEEESDAAKEVIRQSLLTDQQREIEAIGLHYTALIELAKRYGIDTSELLAKQTAEQAKVVNDAQKKQEEDIYAMQQKRLSALQASFTAFGDLVVASMDLIGSETTKSANLQKIATLAKIAFDTAAAISSLVASSSANPANSVTFGAAGVAQYVSGFARIIANMAQARKILTSAPPVQQKMDGRYLVTGQQDNRKYNATGINAPSTGLLPNYPVLFNSNATNKPVLASERGAEYFVSSSSLRDPYIANLVKMIDVATTGGRVSQFAEGGLNGSMPAAPSGGADISVLIALNTTLQQLKNVMASGIFAVLSDSTIIESQKRYNKINGNTGNFYSNNP